MSVWVIESGAYSDYQVVGVFSSRENAERAMALLNDSDATIAEWPLDPAIDELNQGFLPYRVIMLRDGTTESVDQRAHGELRSQFMLCRRSDSVMYSTGTCDALEAWVLARNPEHAVKITNERRTQMIAAGEW